MLSVPWNAPHFDLVDFFLVVTLNCSFILCASYKPGTKGGKKETKAEGTNRKQLAR